MLTASNAAEDESYHGKRNSQISLHDNSLCQHQNKNSSGTVTKGSANWTLKLDSVQGAAVCVFCTKKEAANQK